MHNEDITLAVICDFGGRVRGKGFKTSDTEKIAKKGVGLAYSNLMITCFGEIVETPWGPHGDILMIPDLSTEVIILGDDGAADERFVLCDLVNIDGSPWSCCPRSWLRKGLELLRDEFQLELMAAFEHEFHYSGIETGHGSAYGLDAWRYQGSFAQRLVHILDQNGVAPELVMPEYAPQQMEVTNAPALGVAAADRAVRLREITRSVAHRHGQKATFSPLMPGGGVGNGVHIHFSLQGSDGTPCSYDPVQPHNLRTGFGQFIAGVLAHMGDFMPLTAASNISYERLQPNRWSASCNNLGKQSREAGIRICPVTGDDPERSFNVEFRAADATANPYLALGALVWAGLDGLRRELPVPDATEGDVTDEDIARLGLKRLPASLTDALDAFRKNDALRSWMGDEFHNAYQVNKRGELKLLEDVDIEEQLRRYANCF